MTPEERDFWSFHPVRRPDVPDFTASDRVRTPIDALLLEKLREAGLTFSADADRQTLIRRVSFDLIGLPPSAEDIERFVADESPDAYERLIERLLASPHYGERWARHWLDVAGYADSEGAAGDPVRPDAWKYVVEVQDRVERAVDVDVVGDVVVQEGEAVVAEQVGQVLGAAGEQVVEGQHLAALGDQAMAQVRADEAGASRHQNASQSSLGRHRASFQAAPRSGDASERR